MRWVSKVLCALIRGISCRNAKHQIAANTPKSNARAEGILYLAVDAPIQVIQR